MLLRPALRSCLLAILLTQVAASNFRRQSGEPSGADPDPTPSDDAPETPPSSAITSSSTSSTPSSTSSPTSTPTSTPTADPSTTESPIVTPPPDTTPTTLPPDQSELPPVIVDGSEHISFETVTNSKSASSASATPSETAKDDKKDEDEGIGTGSIVGMSVAGGLAVLGIIAFFVWKFTRKRFSTFDDSEPIKWPELNSHGGPADSHPLPVRDTGRAGFGDAGSVSESDLSRVNTNNYSTTDFSGSAHDPYAVPPLPHLNPNQPYRDDPTSAAGYYDPYRGPVPATVENGQGWEGEAIPMNQIHHAGAAGYEQPQLYAGRQSPGPLQAYDAGRGSPAPPNMGYQQPVGYDQGPGRQSPGPMAAYAARGPSPGPNAAYGAAPGYAQQPPGYR